MIEDTRKQIREVEGRIEEEGSRISVLLARRKELEEKIVKCPKCGFGMIRSVRVWNSRTFQVLMKWICGRPCGWFAHEPVVRFDENDCEHPVYMTRRQWVESNREEDFHYLALVPIEGRA